MRKFRFKSHKHSYPNKQTGAALLLFVLLLVVGATTLLVSKLNKAAAQYYRDEVTMKALLKAKEALIGYAVSYPDFPSSPSPGNPVTTILEAGPGYLPCPDLDFPPNGSPNSCGPDAIGRLPWEFLDIDDIRDSSGEQLWYTLSDNFRNIGSGRFYPLNSETAGQLTVDGISDIVAIIFAPGEPDDSQTTRPSINVADYLEGDNATIGDQSFSSDGNDQFLVITRLELMAAVEKRVMGEVSQVLTRYRNSYGGANTYPLLSPFVNPRVYASATPVENSGLITGVTSAGTGGNTLVDISKDFGMLNIQVGDIVTYEDPALPGSFRTAVVNADAGAGSNTITIDNISNHYPMNPTAGGNYTIARFNGEIQNPNPPQQGLLAYHSQDEGFRTSFHTIWNINNANETTCSQLDDIPPVNEGQAHIDDLISAIQNNDVFVDITNGACIWGGEAVVDCTAEQIATPFSYSPTPSPGFVTRCPSSTLTPPVAATEITQRQFIFRLNYVGDSRTAMDNSPPSPLPSGLKARDVSTNLPQPGADIVIIIRDLNSTNELVGEATLTLSGADAGSITTNDIHYDLAETGGLVSSVSSSTITDPFKNFTARGVLPGQWIENPAIPNARGRISAVSATTVTFSSVGSPALSFTVGDQYRIYNEIPKWFVHNNWHHLMLIAQSPENIPGGSGVCTAGNCISIADTNGTIAGNNDNKESIVIAAGNELPTAIPPQDRTNQGTILDYFEGGNKDGNLVFDIGSFDPTLNTFNDQIKRVAPCTPGNEIHECY